jgi:hypothetical protein
MRKSRTSLKHHLVGLSLAIIALSLGWFFVSAPDGVPIDSKQVATNYLAFDKNDYIGLSRIVAAKAMNKDAIIKFAYSESNFCDVISGTIELKENVDIQVVGSIDVKGPWSGAKVSAVNPTQSTQLCKALQNRYVLSNSKYFRDKAEQAGFVPQFIAVANYNTEK